MDSDCLFCKIVSGSIPAKRVYEDSLCLCFSDINPQAPTHLLIIPKQHIASLAHAEKEHIPLLLGHLMATAAALAHNAKRTAARASTTCICTCSADDRWLGPPARFFQELTIEDNNVESAQSVRAISKTRASATQGHSR
jgi:hypothetical protein